MTEDEHTFHYLSRRTPARLPISDVIVVVSSLAVPVGVVLFALAVWRGWATEVQLAALVVAFLAFLVAFRRYFAATYPQVEAAEPRPILPDQVVEDDVAELVPVVRRRLLLRVLVAAAGALGLAALVPIASLGPRYRPPQTGWAEGVRLVDSQGAAIQPGELPAAGVAVMWPEGAVRNEQGTILLVRLPVLPEAPTRLDWVVDGDIVAYSRVCTHAGCPVAIFRESDSVLYCPCHQAQFDLSRGATPTFGPASRPLPQLPLGVGGDGYLVALGDFTEPVGPPRG